MSFVLPFLPHSLEASAPTPAVLYIPVPRDPKRTSATQDATWVGVVKAGGFAAPLGRTQRNHRFRHPIRLRAIIHRDTLQAQKAQHGSATRKNAQLGFQTTNFKTGKMVGCVYLLDKR
jgi:uncharacterized protein with NRDE domain